MAVVSWYFIVILLSWTMLCLAEGKLHYHDFHLREKNFTRLCVTSSMLVVNDQLPGPTIYVQKGDTMLVNVHNHASYGVTIHWHGVKQPRNPWMDGPVYVTQCPIKPGMNFTYEVKFSDEEGTLWWHAHSDWTRVGVHGAIVIYPEGGSTYPYPRSHDAEEILVFGAWYTYDVNLEVIESAGSDQPGSDSYTINSQPGDFCPCSREGTYRWEVEYGKTYLLRLVNAAMNAELFFSIAGHNMTVVGMDASNLKPFETTYVVIEAGQTMNLLVTTNQEPGQYYMAVRQCFSGEATFSEFDKTNVTAILQYNGSVTPPSSVPYFPTFLPGFYDKYAAMSFRSKLKSLYPQDAYVPKNVTTRMYITANLQAYKVNDTSNISITTLNNVSWVNPGVDVLQAYYYNLSGFYTDDFPNNPPTFYDFVAFDLGANTTFASLGTKVKVLEYGEEVEMVFQSANVLNASVDHPMHLHGHSFYVVGSGDGDFDFVEDPKTYNLFDPPKLNTATSQKSGWLAIRFKATNPGVWLLHCHVERHYSWGMNTVFIVKNGGTPETTIRGPPPNMPVCDDPFSINLKGLNDSPFYSEYRTL
ncbi:hypothetical protein SLE2022_116760 [Rubroshorea leprosula]